MPDETTDDRPDELKAVWTTAYVNDLPDSAFLYVQPGGQKDEAGRTVPRGMRHFPVRDTDGKPDPAHVRNALSRLGQPATGGGWLSESLRQRLIAAAQRLLAGGKALDDDLLLSWGAEVKMSAEGAVSGYLVRFGDATTRDLEGDFFDAQTDFALVEGARSPIYYHHGQDPVLGKRVIGEGTLKVDEVGVWIDGQIKLRDKWEQAVRKIGLEKRLSWSSGTAPHLVEREEATDGARRIKRWPLGLDASLTPTPAEPANIATLKALRAQPMQSLKALAPEVFADEANTAPAGAKPGTRATKAAKPPDKRKEKPMLRSYKSGGKWHVFNVNEEGETTGLPIATFDTDADAEKYIVDESKPEVLRMAEMITAAQTKAMEGLFTRLEAMQRETLAAQPRRGAALSHDSGEVKMVNGKTFADFIYAVMENDVPTLKAMGVEKQFYGKSGTKTLGEQTGPAGAYLVPEQFIPELIRVEPEAEIVYPRADRQSVKGPIALPGLSSAGQTAGVSNFLGGVQAYWTESGEYKHATEPEFTEIKLHPWELSGYCPVKDQLLDRSAINLPQLLTGLFRDALRFYRDEAFLDGTGAGQPLGIIPSPGTFIQARQTAGTITYLDLVRMKGHLLPASWNAAHWIFSISCYETLRTLQDPEGHYIWGADAVGGEPQTILGRPYVFTEKTPILGAQGDVILADERYYYVAEEGGIAIASSEHVLFTQNRTVFKFFLKVDGQEKLPAPIYLKDGVTQVSPFVILGGAATT